jgi:GNAT superfamily N-acetyltransferase
MESLKIIESHIYDPQLAKDYDTLLASLHLTETFSHDRDEIQKVCTSSTSHLYLGMLAERAVAMTTLIDPYDSIGHKTARIEDFSVSREHHRKGFAGIMLKFIIEQASAKGADRIELTSSNKREDAHGLYLKNGFTFVDTNIMRLILSEN